MTPSTRLTSLAKTIAVAAALAALAASTAMSATYRTGDHLVDDSFRDSPATTPVTYKASDRLVDDYFRGADTSATRRLPAELAAIGVNLYPAANGNTAPVADRIVDDYFRDATGPPTVQVPANGFNWGDFGIGAAAMLGLVLLAVLLVLGALNVRHRGGQLEPS
jgi:hypothetical protein